MRFITFLQWWWKKNDYFIRTVVPVIVLWIIPCIILSIWIGAKSFILIFGGIFTVIGCWGIYGLYYWVRSIWEQFNNEIPPDDIKIIRKLKGIPTPVTVEEIDL